MGEDTSKPKGAPNNVIPFNDKAREEWQEQKHKMTIVIPNKEEVNKIISENTIDKILKAIKIKPRVEDD